MSGATNKYKERQKAVAEYVKANQNHIYHAKNMPAFDMRGYAQYIKENGLDPKEISPDIMKRFINNRNK